MPSLETAALAPGRPDGSPGAGPRVGTVGASRCRSSTDDAAGSPPARWSIDQPRGLLGRQGRHDGLFWSQAGPTHPSSLLYRGLRVVEPLGSTCDGDHHTLPTERKSP